MRRSIPSIQGLICFESAAKHLSYTYAAQELCITQVQSLAKFSS